MEMISGHGAFQSKANQRARTVGRNGRAVSSTTTLALRLRRKHQEAEIDDPDIREDSDAAFFGYVIRRTPTFLNGASRDAKMSMRSPEVCIGQSGTAAETWRILDVSGASAGDSVAFITGHGAWQ
jgi:hypothetical protein